MPLQHPHAVYKRTLRRLFGSYGSVIECSDGITESLDLVSVNLLGCRSGWNTLQLLQLFFLGFARLKGMFKRGNK